MNECSDARCTRRAFIASSAVSVAGFGLAAQGQPAPAPPAERRPNIVFLLTDDQRWDSLGCMGNPVIKTPNIDQLAADGVLFTNHFCTTSICMSSRASIFTGLYTRCHGIDDFSLPLPADKFAKTYPVLLREGGYRTGFIGKWGLGGDLPADAFDYFKGFPGQGKYFQEFDGKTVHLTNIMGGQAIEFLKGCSPSQPFCLSISFKAPHAQDEDPRQYLYDPQYESLYQDVEIPMPKTAAPEYFDALPKFVQESEGRTRGAARFDTPEKYQTMVKGYYRLITGVDAAVGRIMTELKNLGLDDNTVVFYTSDNGYFLGEHGMADKWLMYEESIRVPLIIRDPRKKRGTVPSERKRAGTVPLLTPSKRKQAGTVPLLTPGTVPLFTLLIDMAPTMLELAGVEPPASMQGRSLVPLLEREPDQWRHEWFYEHEFGYGGKIPRTEGIRTDRWKYVRYIDPQRPVEELYDVAADPLEERNRVNNEADRPMLEQLRARWVVWREALDAWKPDAPWREPE